VITLAGAALLMCAVFVNPWSIGRLFAADGHIEHPLFISGIAALELVLAASGVYLVRRPLAGSVANLALAALSLVVGLFIAEFGARVMVYGTHAFSWSSMASLREFGEGYIEQPSADPEIRFELKPGLDALYRFARVQTNAAGLRGPEYPQPKPVGVYRIAVLGDSFSLPVGVEREDSFAARLEGLLSQPGGPRVECLNFAVPGYYLRQYPVVLERKALAYDPDAILVGFCAENDHLPPPPGEFDAPFTPVPRVYPMLRSTLVTVLYNTLHPHARLDKTPSAENEAYVRQHFAALKRLAAGRPVTVAYLANLPRDPAPIRRLAEEAGLGFVDCSQGFRVEDLSANSIFHPVDSHPNGTANAVFAAGIAEHLRGSLP
jgi:hypothetical protein